MDFANIVLDDILGYTTKKMDFEKNNVEFQYKDKDNKKNIICFEAKGTEIDDLFARQYRNKKEHSTPVKQTWDHIGNVGLDYGVCTNYKEFILITKEHGYNKYHSFKFNSIKSDMEKLKEFVGVFSKKANYRGRICRKNLKGICHRGADIHKGILQAVS